MENGLTVLSLADFKLLPDTKNRRFMYYDGVLVLGEEDFLWKKGEVKGSHAEEFCNSNVKGNFDNFCRGWIGFSKEYPDGIIHFAPMITGTYQPHLDSAVDFLNHFKKRCVCEKTIVRGFVGAWEQRLKDLQLS